MKFERSMQRRTRGKMSAKASAERVPGRQANGPAAMPGESIARARPAHANEHGGQQWPGGSPEMIAIL